MIKQLWNRVTRKNISAVGEGQIARVNRPSVMPPLMTKHDRENAVASQQGIAGALYKRNIYEEPLREWNNDTRRYVLENAHAEFNRNPDAKPLEFIAQFAIDEGFQLITYNPRVEEELNAFIDHDENMLRDYESEAAVDLLLDGELILIWDSAPNGDIFVRPVPPWQLTSLEIEAGRYRKYKQFVFRLDISRGIGDGFVPIEQPKPYLGEDVTFVAINKRAYELRGRPTIYRALDWLAIRKEWLETRAKINQVMSMISFLVSVDTMSSDQLMKVASRYMRSLEPGSVAVESDKVDIKPISPNVGSSDASEDGRQLLLQNSKAFGLPEFMMSEGQNANLATATAQQLPALKNFSNYQRILRRQLWIPLFKRYLERRIAQGFPEMVEHYDGTGKKTGDIIPTIEAFDVRYKPVTEADILKLTQALTMQHAGELTSRRSAISVLGEDPDRIERELQDERDAAVENQSMLGLRPAGDDPNEEA